MPKKLNGVHYNSLLKTHNVLRSITSLKKEKENRDKIHFIGYTDLTLQQIATKPCQQVSIETLQLCVVMALLFVSGIDHQLTDRCKDPK